MSPLTLPLERSTRSVILSAKSSLLFARSWAISSMGRPAGPGGHSAGHGVVVDAGQLGGRPE